MGTQRHGTVRALGKTFLCLP